MDADKPTQIIDFETNFRRSFGRNPRTSSQTTKVTREEHARLEVAAKRNGQSLGEWSRDVLLRAAEERQVDPTFTEVVALRLLLLKALRGDLKKPEDFDAEVFSIRQSKHKAAQEVMQQYSPKEMGR